MADNKKDFGAAFSSYAGERLSRPVDRIVTGQTPNEEATKPAAPAALSPLAPDDDRLNIRINSDLKEAFTAAAAAEGLKPAAAVKKLMRQYVEAWHRKGGQI